MHIPVTNNNCTYNILLEVPINAHCKACLCIEVIESYRREVILPLLHHGINNYIANNVSS